VGEPKRRRPIRELIINGSIILSWMFLTTCEETNMINLAQDRDKKRAVANTVIFLCDSYERGKTV
jgi:hypothetical protein